MYKLYLTGHDLHFVKWPMHPESTMAVSCGLIIGGVQQSKFAAPVHHSLLAWLPPMLSAMLSALVFSRLCPCLGKLQLKLV
jgi:hypothetical protein